MAFPLPISERGGNCHTQRSRGRMLWGGGVGADRVWGAMSGTVAWSDSAGVWVWVPIGLISAQYQRLRRAQ